MRRSVPVQSLLYGFLYPRPTPNDPANFSQHLTRNLIPEIRIETAQFYGALDDIEARYPGLNYTYGPHIRRLSFFPHHARLFRAIRILGITDREVLDLARWEGTLWAKERFEKDKGIKVIDTTGDDIGPWIDPRKVITTKATPLAVGETAVVVPSASTRPDTQSQSIGSCDTEMHGSEQESEVDESATNTTTLSAHTDSTVDQAPDSSLRRLEIVRHLRSSNSSRSATQPRPQQQQQQRQERSNEAGARPQQGSGQLEHPILPDGLEVALQELIDSWHVLQTSRGLSDDDMSRFRADIFQRVAQLQIDVPATLNIATALQIYLEQRLGTEPRAQDAEVLATTQVISQPAA